ncbi:MAG: M48 family metalloprotease [Phycisphaerales bacterium]|nr:M48 family metalloprotease [Phycisphaerales bacterium]
MLTPESANALSVTVLLWLAQAVVIGTALAMATWLVARVAFRKAPPALVFALWTVVLIKFIAPIGPVWSLGGAATNLWKWAAPTSATTTTASTTTDAQLRARLIPITRGEQPAPKKSAPIWPVGLCVAYLGCAAVIAWRRSARHRKLVAAVWEMAEPSAEVRELVARLARQARVRVPEARITPRRTSPFVIGMSRPVLVLTPGVLRHPEELEAVILHELAHLRRGDMWVRRLQWLAGALLFFWPIVAWVNRRIDLAREQACDEWALRHGSLSPAAYARCLLTVARDGANAWRSAIPSAMAANPSHIERRIGMIMRSPALRPHGRRIGFVTGALALGWCVFALSGAAVSAATDDKPQTKETKQTRVAVVQTDDTDAPQWTVADADGAAARHVIVRKHTTHRVPFLSDLPLIGSLFSSAEESPAMRIEVREPTAFAIQLSDDSPEALDTFRANHPTADVNGDGAVTSTERDAYLVARAMARPDVVLEQYPDADRDNDGALSTNEAARLVSNGGLLMPNMDHSGTWTSDQGHMMVMSRVVSGPGAWQTDDGQEIQLDGADGAEHHVAIRIVSADDSDELEVLHQELGIDLNELIGNVQVLTDIEDVDTAGDAGIHATARAMHDHAIAALHSLSFDTTPPASVWIEENIDVEPAPAAIAAYAEAVEAAQMNTFLELNPAADADGDGVLTAAERDAFSENLAAQAHAALLADNPEMDLNGDGDLTPEELANYFMSHDEQGGLPELNVDEVREMADGERTHSVATMTSGDAKITMTIDASRAATDAGEHTFTLTLDNEGAVAFGKVRLQCRVAGGAIIGVTGPGTVKMDDSGVEITDIGDLAGDATHTFQIRVEAEADQRVRLRAHLRTDHGSVINDAELR